MAGKAARNVREWYAFHGGEEMDVSLVEASVVWDAAVRSVTQGRPLMAGKKKCRIVERTLVDGRVEYVIQQKHFLFRWWWVDAWVNSAAGAACRDCFSTLGEAYDNVRYFDGRKPVDRVVG